ncbi:MAG: radical SAM protein [Campylobacterota bacterium]|nr:radical SAM protein [Campylobacterota bacterium]
MKCIFGPINSRRFGVSLGVDLSPSIKQCNFDCLYCELTPQKAINRQEDVVHVDDIFSELQSAVKEHNNIDVITFTANGEPTMYPYLKELLEKTDEIKGDISTLILSNSTGLLNRDSYNTLLNFDEVKLSLDAVSPDVFKKIDRAHCEIKIEDIANKIVQFSKEFQGKLYIEILFVKNINDSQKEIKKLSDLLLHVEALRVDIGTIDRPPAYNVKALTFNELLEVANMFEPSLPIHIASHKNIDVKPSSYTKDEILNTLSKRPLSKNDIDILFDNDSKKLLDKLLNRKKIEIKNSGSVSFYSKVNR